MKELFAKGKTLSEAYHEALFQLYYHGEISDCPDYNQKQRECGMTMCVESAMAEPMISKLFIGGHADLHQYRLEILDGILDFKIAETETSWEYTYHDRYIRQLPFIYEELTRNPSSRRAVMNIRDFDVDSKNSHPACLQSIQLFVRNNKLDMTVMMRSNDAPEATFMNSFAFIMLQERIAKKLGYDVGSYTHRANSFHCYEKDFKLLESYIVGIETKQYSELTYEYDGFYKELMDESNEEILEKVAKLLQFRCVNFNTSNNLLY